jgi:hypothetical protein
LEVYNIRKSFVSYLYDIRFIILFYVIGDWASTVYALPFGSEYNSVPAMILENYGIYHLLLIKLRWRTPQQASGVCSRQHSKFRERKR